MPKAAYHDRVRVTLVLATTLLIAVGLGAAAMAAPSAQSTPGAANLAPDGIGTVRFGLEESRAVTELNALLGAPAARGVNTGCSPRYTEVEWGDLVAEFRSNRFSGYRYAEGGYPVTTPGSPHEALPPKSSPTLATARGISLGSTLAELRVVYGPLRFIGTDRWQSPNGLVFVDNAEHSPEAPSSRLVEIKIGTCGDF
jgi:hypothetical protein